MTPNGGYILNDLEFAQKIHQMSDRELLEFTAKETYNVTILAHSNHSRIEKLESRTRKELGATGGIGAVFGVAIASVIDYFLRR